MLSESAWDLWAWQHVIWGAIYACLGLRWAPTYGFILSWEVWEAVGRRLVPDDGIFGPESAANIVLDIAVAVLAYHLTRAFLRGLVMLWTNRDPLRAAARTPHPLTVDEDLPTLGRTG